MAPFENTSMARKAASATSRAAHVSASAQRAKNIALVRAHTPFEAMINHRNAPSMRRARNTARARHKKKPGKPRAPC